jgi:hypothetical protein
VPRQAKPKDNTLLEMAIVGYQSELDKINAKIADIKAQLGDRGPGRPKSRLSPHKTGSVAMKGRRALPVRVQLHRTASDPTLDQALWVAIRNRTHA